MSASEFRLLASRSASGRPEHVFRAAVSAFASLTRPTRSDAARLEDLVMPLFPDVPADARRFAAAALSSTPNGPRQFLMKLCDEPIDVAAPLLVRSPALSDVDLIAIIARNGHRHARAIARRRALNPAIERLVAAIDVPTKTGDKARTLEGDAGKARAQLRQLMASNPGETTGASPSVFAKLRDTALSGSQNFFHAAAADIFGVTKEAARTLTSGENYAMMLAALRSLALSEEQAFLIAAAIFPRQFGHPEAVRLFLERFRVLEPEQARKRLANWRADAVALAPAARLRA